MPIYIYIYIFIYIFKICIYIYLYIYLFGEGVRESAGFWEALTEQKFVN